MEEKSEISYEEKAPSSQQQDVKSAAEKKFVRKLNNNILPLVFFIIFVQFCDKSTLSVAAVLGLMEDTNMTLTQFNWVGSIFYLGFLICQAANSILIQKIRVSHYLGGALILWGIVMGCTAASHTFSQLAALRFLLGLFEGVTYPCLYIVLNTFYRRSEQSLVWGFTGMAVGGGTIIGVVLALGFSYMDGLHGWRAWRWGYLIFGILTVVVGVCTFFLLIDDPYHPLLRLTEEEKELVEQRAQDNRVVRVREIKKYQIVEALNEPRFYLIFLISAATYLQNGGIIPYSTLLVQDLGFSTVMSILLQIPNGAAALFFSMTSVLVAHRVKHLSFTSLGTSIIAVVGFILLVTIPGRAKLLGFYLSWAMPGTTALLQSMVSNNVSGYTKKVFYNNAIMVAQTIGNFCGPFMMVESQKPQYLGAMIGFIVTNAFAFVGVFLLYLLSKRENKRRANERTDEPTDIHLDLTDKQDKNFIYKL